MQNLGLSTSETYRNPGILIIWSCRDDMVVIFNKAGPGMEILRPIQ